MSKSRTYFPNKWKAYSDVPADKYESLPFDFFMDLKELWEIKRSYVCVVREVTSKGKVKEHAYQRLHAAKKKVSQLMKDSKEFTVLTYDAMHHISPEEFFNHD